MGLFESFFKEAKDLFLIINSDGFAVEISPSWEVQLGWSSSDLKSKKLSEFLHPEDQGQFKNESAQNASRSEQPFISARFQHKNGTYRYLSWSFKKADQDGHIFSMARDITDVRKNNLSLEALMSSLDDLILVVDESGLFIDLWTSNPKLLFLPADQIIGHHIRDVFGYFGVGFESVMLQSFRLNRALSLEFQFPNKKGWFSAKVNPIQGTSGQRRLASFLIRDISDKMAAGEALDNERGKLLAASKMATLGEMAAGIAHEINNPLAIIQGKAWLLKKQVDENKMDPVTFNAGLLAIHDTTTRISKIIHGLKAFARHADKDPFVEITISSIIDDTLELCREKFKNHGIPIRIGGKRPHLLECRGVQISQVFLNILSNAFDAIEGTTDPWVEVQIKELDSGIEVTFTDSGPGILQAIQEKMFQPFFTTKEIGKGTGLGLSITKGIVESHGGEFFYDKGCINTKFIIRLPKKVARSEQQPA